MRCQRCGAPLSMHRFGLSARCDFCQATSLVDQAGVDAALFAASASRVQAQRAAYPGVIVGSGALRWAPVGQAAQTGRWAIVGVDAAMWPPLRGLLLRANATEALRRVAGWREAAARACAQNRRYHPALPQLVDEHDAMVVLRPAYGERMTFAHIHAVRGALPVGVALWVLVRLVEYAAWLHDVGLQLIAVDAHDLVFACDEHDVLVLGEVAGVADAQGWRASVGEALHVVRAMLEPSAEETAQFFDGLALELQGRAPLLHGTPLAYGRMIKQWAEARFGKRYTPLRAFVQGQQLAVGS